MFTSGFDGEGRLVWASHWLPGLDPNTVLGRPVWEIVDAEYSDYVQQTIGRTLVTGQDSPYEITTRIEGEPVRFRGRYSRPQSVAVLATAEAIDERITRLTPRELSVARYMGRYETKEIARRLGIRNSTVETYRGRIGDKIGLRGVRLIAWCVEQFGR